MGTWPTSHRALEEQTIWHLYHRTVSASLLHFDQCGVEQVNRHHPAFYTRLVDGIHQLDDITEAKRPDSED